MKKIHIGLLFVYIFLILFFVITIFPVVYTFLASFKTNQEILANSLSILPQKFQLSNYYEAWELADFKRYTFNSIYLAFFCTAGSLATAAMGGYSFARGHFKGQKTIFKIFVSTMFVSFGSVSLLPLMEVTTLLHINRSLWGIILIRVFGLNIGSIYIIRNYILALPIEMDEASAIDGCSFFQTFVHITLPLLKPVLATVAILSFQGSWNDYLLPNIFTLSNPANRPLIVGVVALKDTGEAASSWNLMLAGTTLSILPMVVVYLCCSRFIISGLASGAIKG